MVATCTRVLGDHSVSTHARKQRAEALRVLGQVFQEAAVVARAAKVRARLYENCGALT